MQSLDSQVYAFLVTVLAGIIIGVLFDSYRVIRGLVRPKKVFTYLGDLTFWFITTVVVFFLLLIGNWGEIRFYVWVGLWIGVTVYFKYFSKSVFKGFGFILYIIRRALAIMMRIAGTICFVITYPFIIIRNIVVIPVGFIGSTGSKIIKWCTGKTNRFLIAPIKYRLSAVKIKIRKLLKK